MYIYTYLRRELGGTWYVAHLVKHVLKSYSFAFHSCPVYRHIHIHLYLSIYLSIHLDIYLYLSIYICLSIYLYIYIYVPSV